MQRDSWNGGEGDAVTQGELLQGEEAHVWKADNCQVSLANPAAGLSFA